MHGMRTSKENLALFAVVGMGSASLLAKKSFTSHTERRHTKKGGMEIVIIALLVF
jgi:hypothetical protein